MAPQISKEDLVFVHRKTTSEVSVLRAGSLLSRRSASARNSEDHYSRKSRHCSPQQSRPSSKVEESKYSSSDVGVRNFHYPYKHKDVVCRCTYEKHHSCRSIHNFEVRALCAEFFRCNPNEIRCSREQWRATFSDLFAAKQEDSYTDQQPDCVARDSTNLETSPKENDPDQFDIDRDSMFELLHNLDLGDRASHILSYKSSKSRTSSSESNKKSRKSSRQIRNGPNGELDMPKKVWREARPSVYSERHGFDSTVSTPLGTTFGPDVYDSHDYPFDESCRPAPLNIMRRIPKPDRLFFEDNKKRPTSNSTYSRDSWTIEGIGRSRDSNHDSNTRYSYSQAPWGIPSCNECEVMSSKVEDFAPPYRYSNELAGKPVAELPTSKEATELQAAPRHAPSANFATLRELEGESRRGRFG